MGSLEVFSSSSFLDDRDSMHGFYISVSISLCLRLQYKRKCSCPVLALYRLLSRFSHVLPFNIGG